MKKKSTTLLDIATELNLDVSTVSKALKNHPKISESTRKKVKEVARRLNYRPNSIATALVKGSSNIIGVMVPHTDEIFFSSVIRGIEEVAKKKGYRIIIFQSNDNRKDEINNIEIMYQARVDGILASHAMETENFEHYQNIIDQGIPLILFDRYNESVESDVVAIDDFKGAYKAVSHLIEQGCKKIVHISGYQHVHIYSERLRGYKQALLDHDIPFDEKQVFESDMSLSDGRRITSEYLAEFSPPDAIFSSSDYTAMGVIQVLKEQNIDIPGQVGVVGFSNEVFTSFVTPTITSIEQHSQNMGKIAARQLLDQIKGSKESGRVKALPQKTILTPELIIRDSSRKKNN